MLQFLIVPTQTRIILKGRYLSVGILKEGERGKEDFDIMPGSAIPL